MEEYNNVKAIVFLSLICISSATHFSFGEEELQQGVQEGATLPGELKFAHVVRNAEMLCSALFFLPYVSKFSFRFFAMVTVCQWTRIQLTHGTIANIGPRAGGN